jgi:hypothetical protein
MSYRPTVYVNPVFEEMERVFGLETDTHRKRPAMSRPVRPQKRTSLYR